MMNKDILSSEEQMSPKPEELACRHRKRILELLTESLEESDALQANLGAGASELMLMASRLGQLIEAAMSEMGGSLNDFRKLVGPIETYQKLTRQYDRLVGLKARLKRDNKSS